jgi:AmmeMemoRadiSam system protein B
LRVEVRPPAVAGTFYPGDPATLRNRIRSLLAAAPRTNGPPPKALIVPHAGYPYSGPIAASAYATLRPVRDAVTRVILVGPAHFVAFSGLALPGCAAFATPLGEVAVDTDGEAFAAAHSAVAINRAAHAAEHSLETQLPFLQETLHSFSVVALLTGDVAAVDVTAVMSDLYGGAETLVVVSSDLSHYHDYDTAGRIDAATASSIESLEPTDIGPDAACGSVGVKALLALAEQKGLRPHTVDLRNSGDTAGGKSRVVGYGAFVFN